MNMGTKRVLFVAEGPDVEAIRRAIGFLLGVCEKSQKPKEAVLLIPGKQNIRGTTLETALGQQISKALEKRKSIDLPKGGSLILATQRTFRPYGRYDVIIVVYGAGKILDLVDGVIGVETIIVVPWQMKQVERWIRTWNPKIIGEHIGLPSLEVENPVVEEALRILTGRVNLTSGLSHPSDKAAAVELFRILRRNNEIFDPEAIKAWALRNGWGPDGANQLRDLTRAILEGRRVRAGEKGLWKRGLIRDLRKSSGRKPEREF